MDYLAFTKLQTHFLRYFYEEAAAPFIEIRRSIDAGEAPYEPGYSEDGEPPFLSEWIEAEAAEKLLGQCVASLVSDRLKLYIEHWVQELRQRAGDQQLEALGIGVPEDPRNRSVYNQKGWFAGHRAYCGRLGVDWAKSGADLSLIEQLVLARNSAQHPKDVTSMRVRQTATDAKRFPRGAFADAFDVMADHSMKNSCFTWPPRLEVTAENLGRAFEQVDKFCAWLDAQHPLRSSEGHRAGSAAT